MWVSICKNKLYCTAQIFIVLSLAVYEICLAKSSIANYNLCQIPTQKISELFSFTNFALCKFNKSKLGKSPKYITALCPVSLIALYHSISIFPFFLCIFLPYNGHNTNIYPVYPLKYELSPNLYIRAQAYESQHATTRMIEWTDRELRFTLTYR